MFLRTLHFNSIGYRKSICFMEFSKILTKERKVSKQTNILMTYQQLWSAKGIAWHLGGLASWPDVDNTPNCKENHHVVSHRLMQMDCIVPDLKCQCSICLTQLPKRQWGYHTHSHFEKDYSSHFFHLRLGTMKFLMLTLWKVCGWPTYTYFVVGLKIRKTY